MGSLVLTEVEGVVEEVQASGGWVDVLVSLVVVSLILVPSPSPHLLSETIFQSLVRWRSACENNYLGTCNDTEKW